MTQGWPWPALVVALALGTHSLSMAYADRVEILIKLSTWTMAIYVEI
jgi:hypothetical protein